MAEERPGLEEGPFAPDDDEVTLLSDDEHQDALGWSWNRRRDEPSYEGEGWGVENPLSKANPQGRPLVGSDDLEFLSEAFAQRQNGSSSRFEQVKAALRSRHKTQGQQKSLDWFQWAYRDIELSTGTSLHHGAVAALYGVCKRTIERQLSQKP